MILFIKDLQGRSLILRADPKECIDDVKRQIQIGAGVPMRHQRLVVRGRQPNDRCTLQECGVRELSTLHLLLRLRGGVRTRSQRLADRHHSNESQSAVSAQPTNDATRTEQRSRASLRAQPKRTTSSARARNTAKRRRKDSGEVPAPSPTEEPVRRTQQKVLAQSDSDEVQSAPETAASASPVEQQVGRNKQEMLTRRKKALEIVNARWSPDLQEQCLQFLTLPTIQAKHTTFENLDPTLQMLPYRTPGNEIEIVFGRDEDTHNHRRGQKFVLEPWTGPELVLDHQIDTATGIMWRLTDLLEHDDESTHPRHFYLVGKKIRWLRVLYRGDHSTVRGLLPVGLPAGYARDAAYKFLGLVFLADADGDYAIADVPESHWATHFQYDNCYFTVRPVIAQDSAASERRKLRSSAATLEGVPQVRTWYRCRTLEMLPVTPPKLVGSRRIQPVDAAMLRIFDSFHDHRETFTRANNATLILQNQQSRTSLTTLDVSQAANSFSKHNDPDEDVSPSETENSNPTRLEPRQFPRDCAPLATWPCPVCDHNCERECDLNAHLDHAHGGHHRVRLFLEHNASASPQEVPASLRRSILRDSVQKRNDVRPGVCVCCANWFPHELERTTWSSLCDSCPDRRNQLLALLSVERYSAKYPDHPVADLRNSAVAVLNAEGSEEALSLILWHQRAVPQKWHWREPGRGTMVLDEDAPLACCAACLRDLSADPQPRLPRRGLCNGFHPSRNLFRGISFPCSLLLRQNFALCHRVVFSWKTAHCRIPAWNSPPAGEVLGHTGNTIHFPLARVKLDEPAELSEVLSLVFAQHLSDHDIKRSDVLRLDPKEYETCRRMLIDINAAYSNQEYVEPRMVDGCKIPQALWDCVARGQSPDRSTGPATTADEGGVGLFDGLSTAFARDDRDDVLPEIANKVLPVVRSLARSGSDSAEVTAEVDPDMLMHDDPNASDSEPSVQDDCSEHDTGSDTSSDEGSSVRSVVPESSDSASDFSEVPDRQLTQHFVNACPASQWGPDFWTTTMPHLWPVGGAGGPSTKYDPKWRRHRDGSDGDLPYREQCACFLRQEEPQYGSALSLSSQDALCELPRWCDSEPEYHAARSYRAPSGLGRFSRDTEFISTCWDIYTRGLVIEKARTYLSTVAGKRGVEPLLEMVKTDALENTLLVVSQYRTLGEVMACPRVAPEFKTVLKCIKNATVSVRGTIGCKNQAQKQTTAFGYLFGPCSEFVTFNPQAERDALFFKFCGDSVGGGAYAAELSREFPSSRPLAQMYRCVGNSPVAHAFYFKHVHDTFFHELLRYGKASPGALGVLRAFDDVHEETGRGNVHAHAKTYHASMSLQALEADVNDLVREGQGALNSVISEEGKRCITDDYQKKILDTMLSYNKRAIRVAESVQFESVSRHTVACGDPVRSFIDGPTTSFDPDRDPVLAFTDRDRAAIGTWCPRVALAPLLNSKHLRAAFKTKKIDGKYEVFLSSAAAMPNIFTSTAPYAPATAALAGARLLEYRGLEICDLIKTDRDGRWLVEQILKDQAQQDVDDIFTLQFERSMSDGSSILSNSDQKFPLFKPKTLDNPSHLTKFSQPPLVAQTERRRLHTKSRHPDDNFTITEALVVAPRNPGATLESTVLNPYIAHPKESASESVIELPVDTIVQEITLPHPTHPELFLGIVQRGRHAGLVLEVPRRYVSARSLGNPYCASGATFEEFRHYFSTLARGQSMTVDASLECAICQEPHASSLGGLVILPCKHTFCREAIEAWASRQGANVSCPTCRLPIESRNATTVSSGDILRDRVRQSIQHQVDDNLQLLNKTIAFVKCHSDSDWAPVSADTDWTKVTQVHTTREPKAATTAWKEADKVTYSIGSVRPDYLLDVQMPAETWKNHFIAHIQLIIENVLKHMCTASCFKCGQKDKKGRPTCRHKFFYNEFVEELAKHLKDTLLAVPGKAVVSQAYVRRQTEERSGQICVTRDHPWMGSTNGFLLAAYPCNIDVQSCAVAPVIPDEARVPRHVVSDLKEELTKYVVDTSSYVPHPTDLEPEEQFVTTNPRNYYRFHSFDPVTNLVRTHAGDPNSPLETTHHWTLEEWTRCGPKRLRRWLPLARVTDEFTNSPHAKDIVPLLREWSEGKTTLQCNASSRKFRIALREQPELDFAVRLVVPKDSDKTTDSSTPEPEVDLENDFKFITHVLAEAVRRSQRLAHGSRKKLQISLTRINYI